MFLLKVRAQFVGDLFTAANASEQGLCEMPALAVVEAAQRADGCEDVLPDHLPRSRSLASWVLPWMCLICSVETHEGTDSEDPALEAAGASAEPSRGVVKNNVSRLLLSGGEWLGGGEGTTGINSTLP